MALLCKTIYALFLLSAQAFAQNSKTVFITRSDPDEKQVGLTPFFRMASLSIPLRGNPNRTNNTYLDYEGNPVYNNNSNERSGSGLNFFIPDGLSVQGGYGAHLKKWVGVSANTGIDWMATEQLVTVPVYGSLIFNPQLWEEYNVYFQFSAGHAFALGRGNLSGPYQKYRIGLNRYNEGSFYIEVNRYDFPIHNSANTGNVSIGVAFFDFL